MTGRVIREGLRDGSPAPTMTIERLAETVKTADGAYELTAHTSVVEGHRYLDYTEVTRR